MARVAVLGGWIGTLSLMMNAYQLPVMATSIDLDERSNKIAEKLNWDSPGFKALTVDMYEVNYDEFDIIINTASEHIPDISKWRDTIPAGKVVIVQNNNFTEAEGHISTVSSSEELKNILNLQKVMYEGTRKFYMYDRFMIIGTT